MSLRDSLRDSPDYKLLLKFKKWLNRLDHFEQVGILIMIIIVILVIIDMGN